MSRHTNKLVFRPGSKKHQRQHLGLPPCRRRGRHPADIPHQERACLVHLGYGTDIPERRSGGYGARGSSVEVIALKVMDCDA